MSKLSKAQIKAHTEACRVLTKDRLSEDERWFVLENWKESATHINSAAGAFFTPPMLARDFAIETCGPRVIDLCAGIGCLAFMVWNKSGWAREPIEIVCVERNPDYAAVGRKVLPEARWIVGDVFDLPSDLGLFDCAISNPPFGSTDRGGRSAPRYQGRAFEYHVIDVASDLANWGAFIIPQNSAPFTYSGKPAYEWRPGSEYEKFQAATGIALGASCGIDCDVYRGDWNGVAPAVEIVTADFAEARQASKPAQSDLFGAAA
jgi:hypothetical protein